MPSRISRVVSVGQKNGTAGNFGVDTFPSKQLLEDPFVGAQIAGYGTVLRMPPYSLEQLQFLAEVHPVHAAALDQSVSDVVAEGPVWVPDDEDTTSDEQADLLEEWFDGLTEDYTPVEMLQALWHDYRTTGWGMFEVVRDDSGVARRTYHVPSHTVRAHSDGILYAQIRQGRVVWFKKWGYDAGEFDSRTGAPIDPYVEVNGQKIPNPYRANELMVFRRPNSRSSWYGIPGYIASVGHIMLGTVIRDYNLMFFQNNREARHLIVISGMAEDVHASVQEMTMQMRQGLKDPHRTLVLPIVGDAKIQIEKMAFPQNDAQFPKLSEMTDSAVLVGHRMPRDRIGIATAGRSSGGQQTNVLNRIYKDGVVSKDQSVLEDRFNRFVRIEFLKWLIIQKTGIDPKITKELLYHADFEDLDLTDETADTNVAVQLVKTDLMTINEGRVKVGLTALDKFKHQQDLKDPNDTTGKNVLAKKGDDMTFTEYIAQFGASPSATGPSAGLPQIQGPKETLDSGGTDQTLGSGMAAPPSRNVDGNGRTAPLTKAEFDVMSDEVLSRLDDLDGYIEQLVTRQ